MRTLIAKWRVATFTFLIHALLVLGVWALYAYAVSHHDEDPEMQWLWAGLFDFPSSKLVEIIHPRYGIQCALAFLLIGGAQWFIVGALFDLTFVRRRHDTSTI